MGKGAESVVVVVVSFVVVAKAVVVAFSVISPSRRGGTKNDDGVERHVMMRWRLQERERREKPIR